MATAALRYLTEEHVAAYHRDGYLAIPTPSTPRACAGSTSPAPSSSRCLRAASTSTTTARSTGRRRTRRPRRAAS
jgi:hypothetical protein